MPKIFALRNSMLEVQSSITQSSIKSAKNSDDFDFFAAATTLRNDDKEERLEVPVRLQEQQERQQAEPEQGKLVRRLIFERRFSFLLPFIGVIFDQLIHK